MVAPNSNKQIKLTVQPYLKTKNGFKISKYSSKFCYTPFPNENDLETLAFPDENDWKALAIPNKKEG